MVTEFTINNIRHRFTFQWDFIDFFYAYAEAKGYDDIENSDITDEEYDALESECEEVLDHVDMQALEQAILTYGNELINTAMEEAKRKKERED